MQLWFLFSIRRLFALQQLTNPYCIGQGVVSFFCVPSLLVWVGRFVSLAFGAFRSWLVEHGAYELVSTAAQTLLWYLMTINQVYRFFIFTTTSQGGCVASVEHIFRNARWLEREAGEMLNIRYAAKRDRRALFLVPLLYWGPLRRSFPTNGFFELRIHPLWGAVQVYHVTWLD